MLFRSPTQNLRVPGLPPRLFSLTPWWEVQLAWRFLRHQKESRLVQWFEACVAAGKRRKTMIVALARKLLIALWRFVTLGEVPDGVIFAN